MRDKLLILEAFETDEHHFNLLYETKRLNEETTKIKIDVVLATKFDLEFIYNNTLNVRVKGVDLSEFKYLIIRGKHKFMPFLYSLITLAKKLNIKVLNERNFSAYQDYNKLSQMTKLAIGGINVPKSYYTPSPEKLLSQKILNNSVVKIIDGSKGEALIDGINERLMYNIERYTSQKLLAQEKLPNAIDYRILVLNGRSLGIMKRTATKDNLVSNFSQGGKVEIFESDEFYDIAVKATEILECDYGGVDIMLDKDGHPLVLEVNRNAQFQGFEKATGVNVAKEIVDFITKS